MFGFSCGCCTKGVDWDANDVNFATTILPKNTFSHGNRSKKLGLRHAPKSFTGFEKNNLDNLFPDNNLLLSYGNVLYDKILDLNKLTNKEERNKLNVKKISSSDMHSLMLIEIFDESNNLIKTLIYGYGSNENGQLGIDYAPIRNNFNKDWILLKLEKKIKNKFFIDDINVGDDFSIITIKDINTNILSMIRFQLSKEDQFNILSTNSNSIKNCINCVTKEKFSTNDNKGIKQVGCFGNRILVLTNDNKLYMKGILYDMSNATDFIKCASFNENILYITMGINNCLLLSEDNVIYGIGHNEYKEFGISDEEQIKKKNTLSFSKSNSKIINDDLNYNTNRNLIKSNYNNNGNSNNNYNEKININTFFKDRGLNIQKISTGARHSMVLCTNGELYCFGDNSDGQCSGFEKVVDEPTLIEFEEEDEFIIDIKAGFNHSIAKGLSKKIYVWGDSTWGKIGIKESTIDQFDPLEINDMKIRNVINIFAGSMHTGFFTSGDFNLET